MSKKEKEIKEQSNTRQKHLPNRDKTRFIGRTYKRRVGVYAGTFNPIHSGHVAFALHAKEVANLDAVYLMPEREPRGKQPEHYGHRVAMIRRALRPYATMHVLETNEKNFTVQKTSMHLRRQFPDAELVFLFGSDVAKHITSWPHGKKMLQEHEVCVVLRGGDTLDQVLKIRDENDLDSDRFWIVEGTHHEVSSSSIRAAMAINRKAHGLLKSVYLYARREWLYLR